MRSRTAVLIRGWFRKAKETVAAETPASLAKERTVGDATP